MDLTLQWLITTAFTALLADSVGPRLAPEAVPVPETVRQTHLLPANHRIRVEIHSGHIRVIGWERDDVELEAVKSADSSAHLAATKIQVRTEADELVVRTEQPPGNPARVDYLLRVPRRARLERLANVSGDIEVEGVLGKVTASTVNSAITATRVGGDVRLRSVNGSVQASIATVVPGQVIDLTTVNGSTHLVLPAETEFSATGRTVNGVIRADFGLRVVPKFPSGAVLEDRVGDGGVKVRAVTVNGNVSLRAATTIPGAASSAIPLP